MGNTSGSAHAIGEYNAHDDTLWDGNKWVPSHVISSAVDNSCLTIGSTTAGATVQGGWLSYPASEVTIHPEYSPEQMVYMRLGNEMTFQHLHVYRCEGKAVVFIVHENQASIIEDDPGLFPSDKLITQLRLIK